LIRKEYVENALYLEWRIRMNCPKCGRNIRFKEFNNWRKFMDAKLKKIIKERKYNAS
jgi:hypothetical protein